MWPIRMRPDQYQFNYWACILSMYLVLEDFNVSRLLSAGPRSGPQAKK